MLSISNSILRFLLLSVLLVCAIPIIGFVGRDLHWTFDLASHFLLPSVIVACFLSIIAGLLKLAGIGAGALAIAIVASLNVGAWTSTPAAVPPTQPTFSVLLFNVWYRNNDIARVAELIKSKNADLVILLEVTPRIRDQLKNVADGYSYKLGCGESEPCNIYVLSRASMRPEALVRTDDKFRSPLLSFTATFAGCPMTVFATHLTRPFPFTNPQAQRHQAGEVGNEVAAVHGAKLLVGDFNAAPWGFVMQTIAQRSGTKLLTGAGGTWPSYLPRQMRIPIDHMLSGAGLTFVKREVLARIGSDHAPVFSEIAVTNPSMCKAN